MGKSAHHYIHYHIILIYITFSPPFTIQRLCELIVEPCVLYHRRDRYMRALEKVSYKCIINRLIACIYIYIRTYLLSQHKNLI